VNSAPPRARGGEGALAKLPRATWSRPNIGNFFNFFLIFPTCGRRKSTKRRLATKLPSRNCRKSAFRPLVAAASRKKIENMEQGNENLMNQKSLENHFAAKLRPPQVRKMTKQLKTGHPQHPPSSTRQDCDRDSTLLAMHNRTTALDHFLAVDHRPTN